MAAMNDGNRVDNSPKPEIQRSLFDPIGVQNIELVDPDEPCNIVAVAKRRDGGTRYWCLTHKADATAKHGKPDTKCRAADEPPIYPENVLELNMDEYLGGIALWGAVPAVFDTTRQPMDRGIHVHARPSPEEEKEIDFTYRAVRLASDCLPEEGLIIHEIDAIYYMVTSVFQFPMRYVTCTHCGYPHLDKDWFSVHPHVRHLCAGCGKNFRDSEAGIGNPIVGLHDACGVGEHHTTPSQERLDIRQADFDGGIQIWGSNPAFLWTASRDEDEGIHVHAFVEGEEEPVLDETYGEVTIDGIQLEPTMVRFLMAQNVMPSLQNRIQSIDCPSCRQSQFDTDEAAYTPKLSRACPGCGHIVSGTGRLRKTVANPLVSILAELAKKAPREPQQHRLDLLPESI